MAVPGRAVNRSMRAGNLGFTVVFCVVFEIKMWGKCSKYLDHLIQAGNPGRTVLMIAFFCQFFVSY